MKTAYEVVAGSVITFIDSWTFAAIALCVGLYCLIQLFCWAVMGVWVW
jgi:hypothetical protein